MAFVMQREDGTWPDRPDTDEAVSWVGFEGLQMPPVDQVRDMADYGYDLADRMVTLSPPVRRPWWKRLWR